MGKMTFSGHETFTLRHTWPAKGVRNCHLLDTDEAMAELGVGKNMVRAIRYWCLTANLLTESKGPGEAGLVPTPFGERVFGGNGTDPCFDDPVTSWLLHWRLVSRIEGSTVAHLMFNHFRASAFTRESATGWLLDWSRQRPELKLRASENTLKRDVDVFVRSYAPSSAMRARPIEDSLDCPLTDLGLLKQIGPAEFALVRSERPSLRVEAFGYALEDYWAAAVTRKKRETLSLEELMYHPGSPGEVFKLTEAAAVGLLEAVGSVTRDGYVLDSTAGRRQIIRRSPEDSFRLEGGLCCTPL